MTIPVQNIAKFIIQQASPISNLKLQKLLYYAQGWHLGIKGTPLFSEEIQAWVHGPVVPEVFQRYRDFKWKPIAAEHDCASLPEPTHRYVMSVLKAYGHLRADQLERLSHLEDPWRSARKGLDPKVSSKVVISHESMRKYFVKLANG
jgi:uncharacterized phage-associated protein